MQWDVEVIAVKGGGWDLSNFEPHNIAQSVSHSCYHHHAGQNNK